MLRDLFIGIIASAISTGVISGIIALFRGLESLSKGISIWYFVVLLFLFILGLLLIYLNYKRKIISQRRVFIISASMISAPFFAELIKHLVLKLESQGFIPEIKLPQTEYDINEISRHVKYVKKNKDCYVGGFLIYADPEANLEEYRNFVKEFKKPVIFLDSGKSSHYNTFSDNASFIGFDNDQTGVVAAKYCISTLQKYNISKPHIKILASKYQQERQLNFRSEIESKFPGCVIELDDTCDFNRRKAYRAIHTDICHSLEHRIDLWDLIFCTNDEMAIGASLAIADVEPKLLRKVIIIGVDGISEAIEEIDKNDYGFRNTVNQRPDILAMEGINSFVKKLDGGNTAKINYLTPSIYKKV